MANIDRVDWHLNEDFPNELPEENAGTHIGMYLNWIIDNGLIGEMFVSESFEAVENVKAKRMSGRDFLFEECDGKFWNDCLNPVGEEFTKAYYLSDKYLNDYSFTFDDSGDSIFSVENSWENYQKIKSVIDKRFEKWKAKKQKKPWEFWK